MKKYRGRFYASLDAQESMSDMREVTTDTGQVFTVSDIQIFPVGSFASHHQQESGFEITQDMLAEMIENFHNGVKTAKDGTLPVFVGHDDSVDRPAAGWIIDLIDRGAKGLWATVKWNKYGLEQIRNEIYKYISPEWFWEYEDPRTKKYYENVLTSPALVNEPYFNEMAPVVASEKTNEIINVNIMDLQAILAKKVEEMTDEEKAFVKEHEAELTEEQKTAVAAVLVKAEEKKEEANDKKDDEEQKPDAEKPVEAEKPAETVEKVEVVEAPAEKPAEAPAAVEAAPVAEKVEASENGVVRMSASEHKTLMMQAAEGRKAIAEVRTMKLKASIAALKHTPAVNDLALDFAMKLDEKEEAGFLKVLASIPAGVHTEKESSGENIEAKVYASVDEEVVAKAEAYQAANKGVKIDKAINAVLAADKDLKTRYEAREL